MASHFEFVSKNYPVEFGKITEYIVVFYSPYKMHFETLDEDKPCLYWFERH